MEFQKICGPSTPPPAQHTEGNENSEGRGGGNQKETIFEGVEVGWPLESFFFWGGGVRVRLMSKQTVILLLIGVPKQTLMFSSMIFYWRSAECFFHGLHDSLCNPIVVGL